MPQRPQRGVGWAGLGMHHSPKPHTLMCLLGDSCSIYCEKLFCCCGCSKIHDMGDLVAGVVENMGTCICNSYLSVEPSFAFILVFLKGNKSIKERIFCKYCVCDPQCSHISTDSTVAIQQGGYPALCFVSYCDSEPNSSVPE